VRDRGAALERLPERWRNRSVVPALWTAVLSPDAEPALANAGRAEPALLCDLVRRCHANDGCNERFTRPGRGYAPRSEPFDSGQRRKHIEFNDVLMKFQPVSSAC
jgi:hypothetical protein